MRQFAGFFTLLLLFVSLSLHAAVPHKKGCNTPEDCIKKVLTALQKKDTAGFLTLIKTDTLIAIMRPADGADSAQLQKHERLIQHPEIIPEQSKKSFTAMLDRMKGSLHADVQTIVFKKATIMRKQPINANAEGTQYEVTVAVNGILCTMQMITARYHGCNYLFLPGILAVFAKK